MESLLSQRVPERNLWWGSSALPFLVFTLWILMSRCRASRGEWRREIAGISKLENLRRFGILISAFFWMDALRSYWRDALGSAVIDTPLRYLASRGFWEYFRFSAAAVFFGGRAKLLEKSRKPENFCLFDLGNSRDLLDSESFAQHFQGNFLFSELLALGTPSARPLASPSAMASAMASARSVRSTLTPSQYFS